MSMLTKNIIILFLTITLHALSMKVYAGGVGITAAWSSSSAMKVKQIVSGVDFKCALLEDATVKCWGKNDSGELGQLSTILIPNADPELIVWDHAGDVSGEIEKLRPINFGANAGVTQLSAGADHVCAIFQNSRIKCWGANYVGQLGLGDSANRGMTAGEMATLPYVDLGTISGRPITALQISAGGNHNCAIMENSKIKCWGYDEGMLGLGSNYIRGNDPSTMGDNLPFVNLGTDASSNELKALQVVTGNFITCTILNNSTVKCWGYNNVGQLGEGTTVSKGTNPSEMGNGRPLVNLGTVSTVKVGALQLSVRFGFICAVIDTSLLKCWGDNGNFQAKTAINYGAGSAIGDAAGEMGNSLVAMNFGAGVKILQVSTGAAHVCVLIHDGSVRCYGYNDQGELGRNDRAVIGLSAAEMTGLTPINLGTNRKALQIVSGGESSCALLDDSSIKCWGANNYGQLGKGNTTPEGWTTGQMGDALKPVKMGIHTSRLLKVIGQIPKALDARQKFKSLSAGGNHFCAVLENSNAKCWGKNTVGQLGLGSVVAKGNTANTMGDYLPAVDLGTNAIVINMAAGANHTCALMSDSQIKCWGDNTNGQLGKGDAAQRGHTAATMGSSMTNVNVGAGNIVRQVTTGTNVTCVLLDDGTVKCWGTNGYGELGKDNATALNAPGTAIVLGEKAVQISSGQNYNCAILISGITKCWGRNNVGQLGQSNTLNYGDASSTMSTLAAINLGTGRFALSITAGFNHTCAILDDATMKCWGDNTKGQLGQGSAAIKLGNAAGSMVALAAINLGTHYAKQVALGLSHTCVLVEDGSVLCFGLNDQGQLGIGNTTDKGSVAADMGTNLVAVNLGTGRFATQIIAGINQTCAVLDNSTVKCWGENANGELGLENVTSVGTVTTQMGDALPVANMGTSR